MNPAAAHEARRQQWLLQVLLGDLRPDAAPDWLRAAPRGPRTERGLAAYRAHAGALAERALSAACPTLAQVLGEDSFAALARDFWRHAPPQAGDIALWGEALPDFIAAAASLADEPYLPDLARLEWALHRVQCAADAPALPAQGPPGLDLLARCDPQQLRVVLPPGSVVLGSAYPVLGIWQAHRSTEPDRFDAVRAALAAGRGEQVLVTRRGWAPLALGIDAAAARCTAKLLAGGSLAQALQEAGASFDFESWLITMLRQACLLAVTGPEPEETP